MSYDLNSKNFMIYAMKFYRAPNILMSEFEEDIKRVKYVKRMIGRYQASGVLKERIILNHIIVLANVFGVEFATKMLFLKLSPKHYGVLKPFLVFLQYLPDTIDSIDGQTLNTGVIPLDQTVVDVLRKL